MAPLEELDFPAVVVTLALLGLLGLAPLVLLVTKDKQAFQEALDPQASQVPEAKQEELCLYLVPLEQMDFQGPQVLKGPKVIEVFLEPREVQASQERRVLLASLALDFQDLRAPKELMAYLEMRDFLGIQVAQDLLVYLATQACLAKRESLELVCQDSKDCQVFPAFPVHLGRRGTSGDQAFLESMELSGPPAFRESEVTQDLLDCKVPKELQEFLE